MPPTERADCGGDWILYSSLISERVVVEAAAPNRETRERIGRTKPEVFGRAGECGSAKPSVAVVEGLPHATAAMVCREPSADAALARRRIAMLMPAGGGLRLSGAEMLQSFFGEAGRSRENKGVALAFKAESNESGWYD